MRKLALIAALAMLAGASFGATGWYNDYVVIDSGAGGSWYWIGDNPGWAVQLDGHAFGSVSTLSIGSADMKYWSDNQDRTGSAFYYSVDGVYGAETILTQTFEGGNNYQGTWSGSINVLNGLTTGVQHTLSVWAKSWGSSQGDNWLSNSSLNYNSTFTPIPEPSTMALIGLGVGAVLLRFRRR